MSRTGPLVASLLCTMALPSTGVGQAFDRAAREAAMTRIGELLVESYVFPDQAQRCAERLDQLAAAGELLDVERPEAFAEALTRELQDVTHDKHLRVTPGGRPPAEPSPEEEENRFRNELARARMSNFGFENVLRLPDNVGVLDLRGFYEVEPARDTAVAAMNFLANSDALIVDLRQNGGGDPAMVQLLCSYLFAERTHLNSLFWREGDRTEEFWTLDELPGKRMPDVPVFVLTSHYTFSGAEEFAYNLQTRGRATLVGETTGGGAHPGGPQVVNEHLTIFIPTGRAINPVTGTNWEGTGVVPEVAVPAGDAMKAAIELARTAAREHRDALDRS